MKSFLITFLTILCVLFYDAVSAQDCTVALAAISGTYTGDCKKGKADGTGESVGKDKYKGEFKAGLPDGKGVYTFASGDTFDGLFVKGVKQGRGVMSYKRAGKADSVINGVWANDKYIGNFEKPYIVYNKGQLLSRVDARKNAKSPDNNITFNISSASAGAARMSGAANGTGNASLGDIRILKGSFSQTKDGASRATGTSKTLVNVTFPFRAMYSVGGQDLDMEILEPGDWTITIDVKQ